MKVAKNMDSVFANCTQDELDFEALFDNDDCLIDMVAGVNEAGELITGEDFDFMAFIEANAMIGDNPDFDYQKDGDAAYSIKDAEGTKNIKPQLGGEVGTSKNLAGFDSAEKNAYDTKDEEEAIGFRDKQRRSLKESDDETDAQEDNSTVDDEGNPLTDESCKEDASEGPLEDDDEAERAGEVSDTTITTEEVIEFDKAIDTMLENIDLDHYLEASEDAGKAKSILSAAKEKIMNLVAGDRKVNAAISQNKDPRPFAIESAKKHWAEMSNENKNLAKIGVTSTIVAAAAIAGIAIAKKRHSKAKEDSESTNESTLANKILESVLGDDVDIDALLNEFDDPKCPNDTDAREGKISRPTNNVEGRDAEPIGAAIKGISHTDVIEDLDDAEQRHGKTYGDTDVEGVSSRVVEAVVSALVKKNLIEDLDDAEQRAGKTDGDKHIEGALESALEEIELEEEVDFELDEVDLTLEEIDITLEADKDIVPDSVQVDDDSNDIPIGSDAKRAEKKGIDESKESIMEAIRSIFEETEEAKAANDDDEDEALVDIAKDIDSEDVGDVDLSYDPDDEDIIDMVNSGKVDLDDIE